MVDVENATAASSVTAQKRKAASRQRRMRASTSSAKSSRPTITSVIPRPEPMTVTLFHVSVRRSTNHWETWASHRPIGPANGPCVMNRPTRMRTAAVTRNPATMSQKATTAGR